MKIAGIDGCRGGWFVVEGTTDGGIQGSLCVVRLEDYLSGSDAPGIAAIDIPIGLSTREPRDCDLEARKLLGPRKSSVFPAPIRACINCKSHAEVSETAKRITGKGVSIQSFCMFPKIAEVDGLLRANTHLQARVREVHPELCFTEMYAQVHGLSCPVPMKHNKRTKAGFEERKELLKRKFPSDWYCKARDDYFKKVVSNDDILDAAAAFWTATRIATGRAIALPSITVTDDCGLCMTMWR